MTKIITFLTFVFLFSLTSFGQHHFKQEVETYHYQLSQPDASFNYDTVLNFVYSTRVEFKIKNDLKAPIVIQRIRVSDGPVVIVGSSHRYGETVAPGEELSIKISTSRRLGPIRRSVAITYLQNDVEKGYSINIRGWVINMAYYINELKRSETFVSNQEFVDQDLDKYRPYYLNGETNRDVYMLSENDRCLQLTEKPSFFFNYIFEVKNNTGKQITLDRVSATNHQLVFFVKTQGEWTWKKPANPVIPPDSSFLVKALNPHHDNLVNVNIQALVFYHKDEKACVTTIPIFKKPLINSASASEAHQLINKKKSIIYEPSSTSKKQTQQSTYKRRPDGVNRYGEGNVTEHQEGQFNYEFILDEKRFHPSYGFPKPKREKDIFSWDTIGDTHYGIYTFRFLNKTEEPLYLMNISAGSRNLRPKNKSKAIIQPDSSVVIEIQLDSFSRGHFYEKIGIDYHYQGKSETYILNTWGFQPKERLIRGSGDPMFRDSIRVYIINKELETLNSHRLRISYGDDLTYPTLEKENENYVYKIRKTYRDSIRYEVIDNQNRVVKKGLLTNEYKQKSIFFWANTNLDSLHFYRNGAPRVYKCLENKYFLDWEKTYSRTEIIDYLKSLGIHVSEYCSLFINTSDKASAIKLQQKLSASKYQIDLLPVISYSPVSEQGWGGGCRYYTKECTVSFYPGVVDKQAELILTRVGISDFQKLENHKGYKRYRFELEQIVDLKYVHKLDQLWQYFVVADVGQSVVAVAGMD